MSSNQPTIFGGYEWARQNNIGSLWANSFVPQTYSLTLADSMSETDAELFSTIKVLADTVTLTEAQAKTLSHAFSDSVTASSAIAKTLTKVFSESASVSDSSLTFTIKSLTDFLVLKEWISIRLTKALVWTNPTANANLHDTLWGKYLFATQLFGGVKPASTWNRGTRGPSVWTNTDGSKYNY